MGKAREGGMGDSENIVVVFGSRFLVWSVCKDDRSMSGMSAVETAFARIKMASSCEGTACQGAPKAAILSTLQARARGTKKRLEAVVVNC